MDLPTRTDLYAIGRAYLLQNAKKIDPGQVDVQGSDANLFVGSQSVVAYKLVKQIAYSVARLTLDGAEGDDLDRLVWDRYSMTRKGAVGAVGTVTFSRAAATLGAGVIPAGTTLVTLTNVQYVTTADAVFGVSSLSASADVRAAQAGKSTQVGANQIRRVVKPGLLFDQTISCSNAATTAGGEEREDDDTLRARARNFWNTARRGILAAIEFGALTVAGVVSAQAIEALNGSGQPARIINLYISDSSGVASQALARLVQTALDDYRAGGITVLISTSIPIIVDVQLALSFAGNVDTVTLSVLVQAAVVEFINSLPVNGPLYIQELSAVLQRFKADGLIPSANNITAPVGDLIPSVGQTIRTLPGHVTVS